MAPTINTVQVTLNRTKIKMDFENNQNSYNRQRKGKHKLQT